jgi:HEAT repeat protein
MNTADWDAITRDLRGDLDPDRMAAAAERLHKSSTAEDIPRLRELLGDDSFFVREAAAWPLVELAGVGHVLELLQAYQRGLEDGHDNDGFTAALIDLAESDPVRVAGALEPLAHSNDEALRENARWLLTFCAPKQDA